MTSKKLASAKERIKGARRQRRHARMNLRGDLVEQIDKLNEELEDMRERPDGAKRLADPSTETKAKKVRELQSQMEDGWLDFTLEQRPWAEWRAFKAAHPARENEEYDKVAGVDFDALTQEFMPKCVVDPELDAEDWEELFDKCAPADLRDLGAEAYSLHERRLDIPKSRIASAVTKRSGEASERLATGG